MEYCIKRHIIRLESNLEYHESGNLFIKGGYYLNNKHGSFKFYFEDGKKVYKKNLYNRGIKIKGEICYY